MNDYLRDLLTSESRAAVFRWTVGDPAPLTVSALAKKLGFTHRTVRLEVERLERVGLLRRRRVGSADLVAVEQDSPLCEAVAQLVHATDNLPAKKERARRRLLAEAVLLGAPLVSTVEAKSTRPPETLLLDLLKLSRTDAVVLRALPAFLVRLLGTLDWDELRAQARARRQKAELGMLAALTSSLTERVDLGFQVEELKDRRRRRNEFYHSAHPTSLELEAAGERTPAAVREWGFLMNMDEATFRKTLELHEDV